MSERPGPNPDRQSLADRLDAANAAIIRVYGGKLPRFDRPFKARPLALEYVSANFEQQQFYLSEMEETESLNTLSNALQGVRDHNNWQPVKDIIRHDADMNLDIAGGSGGLFRRGDPEALNLGKALKKLADYL